MGKARLSKSDYMVLAKLRNLEHLGSIPANVKIKTKWRCLRCDKRMNRTYRGIEIGKGCSCHDPRVKQEADYHALAKRLGIEWVEPDYKKYYFPRNTKIETRWRNPKTGKIVLATWHMMTHSIRSDIAEALGLN